MANDLYGIRNAMNQLGLDDKKIGWDNNTGTVLYDGKAFMKPDELGADDRAYSSPDNIIKAYNNFNVGSNKVSGTGLGTGTGLGPTGTPTPTTTNPTDNTMSWVREGMAKRGMDNSQIGWDPQLNAVTYQGKYFMQPMEMGGKSYATNSDIDKAVTNYQNSDPVTALLNKLKTKADSAPTHTEDPQIAATIAALQGKLNSSSYYNPTNDPSYIAAKAVSDQGATQATRDAEEELNDRGILNSTIMGDRANQIKQDANVQLAATVPQYAQLYYNNENSKNSALSNLLSTLIGRDTTNRQLTDSEYNSSLDALGNILTGTQNKQTADQNYDIQNKEVANTSRGLDIEEEKNKISAALQRTAQFGKVANQEDADILGVSVGTDTFEAINAAATRAAELQMNTDNNASREKISDNQIASSERTSNNEIASRERISSNQIAATRAQQQSEDTYKNFTKDMQVWESTGKAPDTPALRAYGIAPGTEWTGNISDQLNKIKLDAANKDAATSAELDAKASAYKNSLKLDDNTAQALAQLASNGNRDDALAKLTNSSDQLAAEGVDVEALRNSLSIIFPNSQSWSMPSDSDYSSGEFVKDDLTTDIAGMDAYGQEIRSWLDTTSQYASQGDPVAIDALNYFYKNFPEGQGNLDAKVQFVRSRANDNHTTQYNQG